MSTEYKFQDIPNKWEKLLSSARDELPDCIKDKILLALMETLGNNMIKEYIRKIAQMKPEEVSDKTVTDFVKEFNYTYHHMTLEAIWAIMAYYDEDATYVPDKVLTVFDNHYMAVINEIAYEDSEMRESIFRYPTVLNSFKRLRTCKFKSESGFEGSALLVDINSTNNFYCHNFERFVRPVMAIHMHVIEDAFYGIYEKTHKDLPKHKVPLERTMFTNLDYILGDSCERGFFRKDFYVLTKPRDKYFKDYELLYYPTSALSLNQKFSPITIDTSVNRKIDQSHGEVMLFSGEIADLLRVKLVYYKHEFIFNGQKYEVYFYQNF